MADAYIDQFETQSYGPFAVSQVESLVLGLDPNYLTVLKHLCGRVTERTEAMADLLKRVDAHVEVTYKSADGEEAPGAEAVATRRTLVSYAGARDDGDASCASILNGRTITAVSKLRPARLPEVLDTALKAVQKHKDDLPEHAAWIKRLRASHEAVTDLNTRVRASRSARREMTPEVAAARESWLVAYGSLKLAVESALKLHGKLRLMPEVFDDLAEIHRASGVSDGETPPEAPSAPEK